MAEARKLLTTILAMFKNHEPYCPQKTARAMTNTQLARLLDKQTKQFSRRCQHAAGLTSSVLQTTNLMAEYL